MHCGPDYCRDNTMALISDIIEFAAQTFYMPPEILTNTRKKGNGATRARYGVALALHRRGWSFSKIAKVLGYCDHTTIHPGIRKAQMICEDDANFARRVERIANFTQTAA